MPDKRLRRLPTEPDPAGSGFTKSAKKAVAKKTPAKKSAPKKEPKEGDKR